MKRSTINTAVFSIMFSLTLLVSLHIPYEGSMYVLWEDMRFKPFELRDVLSFVLAWTVCTGCLLLVRRAAAIFPYERLLFRKNRDGAGEKRAFLISFAVIFMAWMTLFMAYLPGTGFVDSYLIIQNGIRMSRQHPWLYNLLLWGFARSGELILGDINLGLACYSVCQMLIMAAVAAGGTAWLSKKGVSCPVLWFVRLYYMILPVFGLYSFSAVKDSIFAVFFLLLFPLILEMVQRGDEFWANRGKLIGYMVCCAGMIIFRNNGLYIVIVLTAVLALMFRRMWRKVVFAALIPAVVFAAVPSLGLKALGKEMYFQEAVAIPLQQMVSVVVNDGRMTEEQRDFMERLLPAKKMKDQYYPMNADLIKWDEDFDRDFLQANKWDFIKYWFQMLIPNLSIYLEAYAMQTYTFWSPLPVTEEACGYSAPLNHEELGIVSKSAFPGNMTQRIHQWVEKHNDFLNPGTMMWIIFFCVFIFLNIGKIREAAVFLPQLLLWGTLMVSVPVAESFRYLFPVAYTLPLSVCVLPIIKAKYGVDE